jgi:hypothetical protein
MKITLSQLRQIICEEIQKVNAINEAPKNVKNVPVKKVGDIVRLRGKTSMADSGIENDKFKIKKVDFRHDSKTGEKYPIYFAASSWYDGRNGSDIKNKSSMYYIDIS